MNRHIFFCILKHASVLIVLIVVFKYAADMENKKSLRKTLQNSRKLGKQPFKSRTFKNKLNKAPTSKQAK